MNISDAKSIYINGKEIRSIMIDGRMVYEKVSMTLLASKEFIVSDETVDICLESDLKEKEVELFKVIGMTRTSLGSKTTGSDGKASWSYTGTGAGTVGFVAVYDNMESKKVIVDDYVPFVNDVILSASELTITYGQSVTFTANVEDQHGEAITIGTVTFKANGTTIGTGTISSGVATLTKSDFNVGDYSITAEVNNVVSNSVAISVIKIPSTISLASDKQFITVGESFTLSGVLSVGSGQSVKLYEGQTLVDTLTTGAGGAFSKTISDASGGGHFYTAIFEGTTNYDRAESMPVSVVVGTVAMSLGITGSSFTLSGNLVHYGDIIVDWGDGTTSTLPSSGATHNYQTSGNYTINVTGAGISSLPDEYFLNALALKSVVVGSSIRSLGEKCFAGYNLESALLSDGLTYLGDYCFAFGSITDISIPASVTDIGAYCFRGCSSLTEIVLNWDTSSDIPLYVNTWIAYCNSFDHFLIPQGTTALYEAKGYPSNLLQEVGADPDSIDFTLTAGKSILSYADVSGGNEYATLTATVYDEDDNPLEGVDVNLYNGATLWDTLTTGSDGTVSKTYTSQGSGDITFTAEVDGTLLTKTFVIIDGLYAHINEIVENQTNTSNVLHNVNVDSNLSLQLPTNFELAMKVKSTMTNSPRFGLKPVSQKDSSNPNYLVMVEQTSTIGRGMYRYNSNLSVGNVSIDGTNYQDWKIKKQGNVFKWYLNDVQIGSDVTLSWFDTNNPYLLAFYYWQGGTMYVKDLVIKPLQSIDISVDNPILSFADSTQANPQIATLTATVNPVAQGRTVKIYKDDTLVATETTDSQGQVSYEYESQGVGDVEFEFECGALSETTTIEDCTDYQALTSDAKESRWDISSALRNSTFGYNANGWKFGNASGELYYNTLFNTGISIEFKLTERNSVEPICRLTDENKNIIGTWFFDSSKMQINYNGTNIQTLNQTPKLNSVYRVEYTFDSITVYEDDVQIMQSTGLTLPTNRYFHFGSGGNRYMRVKDFKIKPL